MRLKALAIYKIPLLISLTLSIVLIALKLENDALAFAQIFIGSFLGVFVLDADYLLHTYFLEPEDEFSKSVSGYFKHMDLGGALAFIYHNRHTVSEKTLHSFLFQIVLLGACVFIIVSSNTNLLIQSLVLSTFVNSFYRMIEFYFDAKINEWFWVLKSQPSRKFLVIYCVLLVGAFVYFLRSF